MHHQLERYSLMPMPKSKLIRYFTISVIATVLAVTALFALYSALGFLILPGLGKSLLVSKLSETLHRKVSIGSITLDPYRFTITLTDLDIKDRDGQRSFASLNRLFMDLDPGPLLKGTLAIRDVRWEKPFLNIVRNSEFEYNFQDILDSINSGREKDGEKKPESSLFKFAINNIKISNGEIRFDDIPMNEKHSVEELTLTIPFVSNTASSASTSVQPAFSALVNNTYLELTGATMPFSDSLQTDLSGSIRGINLPYYLAYIPGIPDIDMLSGNLDASLCVSFSQESKSGRKNLIVEGDLALKNAELLDRRGGDLLAVEELNASNIVYDIYSDKLSIEKVTCSSPRVNVTRGKKGEINLISAFTVPHGEKGDAEDGGKEKQKAEKHDADHPGTGQTGFNVAIDDVIVEEGTISCTDYTRHKPFKTIISPVDLSLHHFSTAPGSKSGFTFNLETEEEESLDLEGDISFIPFHVEGTLELLGVPLHKYAPYYGDKLPFDIPAGKLEAGTSFKCSSKNKKGEVSVSVSDLSATITDFHLKGKDQQKEFLSARELGISGASLDLTGRSLAAGKITASGGNVFLKRGKDGTIGLNTILPGDDTPETVSNANEQPEGDHHGGKSPSWRIALGSVNATDCTVEFRDEMPRDPVTLTANRVDLSIEDLSAFMDGKSGTSLSLLLNGKDSISLKGEAGISPIHASLHVDGKVNLMSLRSYFPETMNVTAASGWIGATGDLVLTSSVPGGYSARYEGSASLSDFKFVARKDGTPLLAGKSLVINSLSGGYNPTFLNVSEAVANYPYTNLIVLPDGKLNLQALMGGGDQPQGQTAAPPPVKTQTAQAGGTKGRPSGSPAEDQFFKQLRIDKVVVKGGIIQFTDKRMHPYFWTSLDSIEGSITGFVLGDVKPAGIQLTGKQNNYSPLRIEGKILPFRKDLLVDVSVKFQDFDMVQINPYSKRILGHNIHKGKAFLDLRYLIDKNKIESQNIVVIDNISLGGPVESPEAINLPIKAAIAILKNKDGEIHLDIPISGNLDDPTFSFRQVITNFLYSLLKKIITAPFAFLGMPFGGGEELRYLEFDPGSSDISEPTRKKLGILIQVIQDKPKLDIELEGHVDLVQDREKLKKNVLMHKLQEQKFREMLQKGLPATTSVEEIRISREEYDRYLEPAYKEETFPKPKNMLGIDKSLPPREMESLMLQYLTVDDEDLRLLAIKRAITLRDHMATVGGIDPGRIYLVEPESLAPQKEEDLKDSRVDIRLR